MTVAGGFSRGRLCGLGLTMVIPLRLGLPPADAAGVPALLAAGLAEADLAGLEAVFAAALALVFLAGGLRALARLAGLRAAVLERDPLRFADEERLDDFLDDPRLFATLASHYEPAVSFGICSHDPIPA